MLFFIILAIVLMVVSGGAIHIPLAWAWFRWDSNNSKKKREEEEAYFESQQEKKKSEKSRLYNIGRNTGNFTEYNAYNARNEGFATKKKVTSDDYKKALGASDEYIRLEQEYQERKRISREKNSWGLW